MKETPWYCRPFKKIIEDDNEMMNKIHSSVEEIHSFLEMEKKKKDNKMKPLDKEQLDGIIDFIRKNWYQERVVFIDRLTECFAKRPKNELINEDIVDENEIKIGDVVVLKSGSDPMTVSFIEEKSIQCILYVNGKFDSVIMPKNVLVTKKT